MVAAEALRDQPRGLQHRGHRGMVFGRNQDRLHGAAIRLWEEATSEVSNRTAGNECKGAAPGRSARRRNTKAVRQTTSACSRQGLLEISDQIGSILYSD